MSSVLHPTGPEPPETYWVRRALVIGAAIVALIVLIAVVVSQNSDGSVVVQGSPSPVAPTPVETALATPTPTETASSSATASPTAGDSTAKATAKATASSSATATSSSSAKAKAQADAKAKAAAKAKADAAAKAKADAAAKAKADAAAKAKAKAEAAAKAKAAAGPGSCPAAQLRATLTGDQKLKPKEANTFKVSLINGSGVTCFVDVTPQNFELKIYSGKDRIWSSQDCTKSIKGVTKKLLKEEAAVWSVTWNGRRSAKDCKQRPEIPRSGTYIATAEFEGAKPVKLRMILKK